MAEPPVGETLSVLLEAARLVDQNAPGSRLLDWSASQDRESSLRWDRDSRAAFFELLRAGGPRSWRFLSITGALDRSLPELAAAVNARQTDPYGFDPLDSLAWPTLEGVREIVAAGEVDLQHPEWVSLAAVIHDAAGGEPREEVVIARRVSQRLETGAAAEEAVAGMLRDRMLFITTARRLDAFGSERVQQMAQHFGNLEQATALLVLALATDAEANEAVMHQRLMTLHEQLVQVLSHPGLVNRQAANVVEARRAEAARLIGESQAAKRLGSAPRALVLSQPASALAELAELVERQGGGRTPLVSLHLDGDGRTRVEIAAADQPGLLASQAAALSETGLDVVGADLGIWDDGRAGTVLEVDGQHDLDTEALRQTVAAHLRRPLSYRSLPDAMTSWDDEVSPWHTVLRVEHPDEPGLLASFAAALSGAGLDIHSAHVTTTDGIAVDTFDVSDREGAKVDAAEREALTHLMLTGSVPPRGRRGRLRIPRRREATRPG